MLSARARPNDPIDVPERVGMLRLRDGRTTVRRGAALGGRGSIRGDWSPFMRCLRRPKERFPCKLPFVARFSERRAARPDRVRLEGRRRRHARGLRCRAPRCASATRRAPTPCRPAAHHHTGWDVYAQADDEHYLRLGLRPNRRKRALTALSVVLAILIGLGRGELIRNQIRDGEVIPPACCI